MQTPGVVVTTQVKMVTRRRRRVTSRPILPPISSDGIRNEIQETTTNRPGLKNVHQPKDNYDEER